ncbi:hypothetical protein EV294_11930 [Paenibacillus sp. BK033]|nr:hypothetical protein [Paenibacillus sp. BK720]TCM86655.1 hypothetical protein EV294_11930 [Paenibacillus sp. BK033]
MIVWTNAGQVGQEVIRIGFTNRISAVSVDPVSSKSKKQEGPQP